MLVTTSCIEYDAHMMILVLVRAKKIPVTQLLRRPEL